MVDRAQRLPLGVISDHRRSVDARICVTLAGRIHRASAIKDCAGLVQSSRERRYKQMPYSFQEGYQAAFFSQVNILIYDSRDHVRRYLFLETTAGTLSRAGGSSPLLEWSRSRSNWHREGRVVLFMTKEPGCLDGFGAPLKRRTRVKKSQYPCSSASKAPCRSANFARQSCRSHSLVTDGVRQRSPKCRVSFGEDRGVVSAAVPLGSRDGCVQIALAGSLD